MVRLLLALVMALTLLATARSADDLPGPAIDWPEVKGLDKQKAHKYKETALGYSVSYLGEDLVVTCFVYNLDLEKIPTGPYSDVVKAEMYESALALEANKANGRYKRIEPLDEKVIPLGSAKGAPQIRRKRYEIDIAKECLAITELYLTGYKNYFIKIRATYPMETKAQNQKLLDALLDGLGKGLN